jgi:hypothetical protein
LRISTVGKLCFARASVVLLSMALCSPLAAQRFEIQPQVSIGSGGGIMESTMAGGLRGQALWERAGVFVAVQQRLIGGWSASCEDFSGCNDLFATQASFGITGITAQQGPVQTYLQGGFGLLAWDRSTPIIEAEIGFRGPSAGSRGVLFGVRALAMPWDEQLADDPVLEAVLGLFWRIGGS